MSKIFCSDELANKNKLITLFVLVTYKCFYLHGSCLTDTGFENSLIEDFIAAALDPL